LKYKSALSTPWVQKSGFQGMVLRP
jgi:hypothetical protein